MTLREELFWWAASRGWVDFERVLDEAVKVIKRRYS